MAELTQKQAEALVFHFYSAVVPYSIVAQKSNSLHLCMERDEANSRSRPVFNKRACHHPIFNPSLFFVRLQMVPQL
jgi:hypothetical protein